MFHCVKNIIVYLVCVYMCVCVFFFFINLKNDKWAPWLELKRKFYALSNQVDPMFFKIFKKLSTIEQCCLKSKNW